MKSSTTLINIICFFQLQWLSLATPIGTSVFGLSSASPRMARLQSLDVKCGRSGMTVHIDFDQLFPGVIYSKGHFYDPSCNYISQQATGQKSFTFLIPIHSCGTTGNLAESTAERDMYFENTIIIQNDPLIQEVWDEARRLRCSWQHTISKSVTTAPFAVQDPEMVSLQWDSRSINTLMQIQRGSSPFSSPATGYINVGEDTSIVIYVQESGEDLDANVVSCKVKTSQGDSVSLIDSSGCLLRPDLLSPFRKLRHPNNIEADLMFYSYLKAFRIGESMDFIISCQLEVCEKACLEPCALGLLQRRKREASPLEGPQGGPTKELLQALEEPQEGATKNLIQLQRGVIVLSRSVENNAEEALNCSLNQLAALIVALFVVLFAVLSALTSYLALRLHSLHKQLKS